MPRKFITIILVILLLGAFSGVIILNSQNQFFQKSLGSTVNVFNSENGYVTVNSYGERIYITNPNDIKDKRTKLIQYIWKNEGFPTSRIPEFIEKNIKDDRYADLDNLKNIDKIVTSMNYGVNSIAYHFHPLKSNNHLMIYHQGHDGDFIQGKQTIQFFLKNGYSVMAFSMPLMGMNNEPTIDLPPFGKITLLLVPNLGHAILRLLETENFSPIKFFLEPIVVATNYIEKSFNYQSINMIGLSGGGWTTTLSAAVDSRISKSYPVAGSLPLYLRTSLNPNDIGDYEQYVSDLYRICNYLELYILGAYGEGRKQLQMLVKDDPCCFGGFGYQTYEKGLKEIISKLGKGKFAVYLDVVNQEHSISNKMLEIVLNDLKTP
jgi:hypothetical protein